MVSLPTTAMAALICSDLLANGVIDQCAAALAKSRADFCPSASLKFPNSKFLNPLILL